MRPDPSAGLGRQRTRRQSNGPAPKGSGRGQGELACKHPRIETTETTPSMGPALPACPELCQAHQQVLHLHARSLLRWQGSLSPEHADGQQVLETLLRCHGHGGDLNPGLWAPEQTLSSASLASPEQPSLQAAFTEGFHLHEGPSHSPSGHKRPGFMLHFTAGKIRA